MTHTFTHKFQDGAEIKLLVDLSKDRPSFKIEGELLENNYNEYNKWKNLVISEDLLKLMSKEQLFSMTRIGINQII